MFTATFGISETGSVRESNQDCYLLDAANGIFAVADGLGGLPYGDRASRMAIEILHNKLLKQPTVHLADLFAEVNEETRKFGFDLDSSGFGTTLTLARFDMDARSMEIGHVGDSALLRVREGAVTTLTVEHTVAARMVASNWEEAGEAIPPSAHHTLTQCIGQEPYIDPQVLKVDVEAGDRFFLVTDGVSKPLQQNQLIEALSIQEKLDRVCQALTFRIEIAGSPDNYTMVAIEL